MLAALRWIREGVDLYVQTIAQGLGVWNRASAHKEHTMTDPFADFDKYSDEELLGVIGNATKASYTGAAVGRIVGAADVLAQRFPEYVHQPRDLGQADPAPDDLPERIAQRVAALMAAQQLSTHEVSQACLPIFVTGGRVVLDGCTFSDLTTEGK